MSDTEGRSARWVAFGRWFADQRIKLSRKYGRKVTQEEIAVKLNMHPRHISRIETGESGTELSRFPDIAKIFEVEESEVYKAAGIGALELSPRAAFVLENLNTGKVTTGYTDGTVGPTDIQTILSEMLHAERILSNCRAALEMLLPTLEKTSQ